MTLLEKYMPHDWDTIVLPESVKKNLQNIQKQRGYRLLLFGSPGNGKCLGKDTPVMMADGTTKKVQDIKVGDLLMGPDSKPREVLSLARGRERMVKIVPTKGMSWTCNESHILCLLESGKWRYNTPLDYSLIQDESVKTVEYEMNKTKWFRKKLFKVPLNFQKQEVKIDPYWLGYWLGDGTSSDTHITMSHSDYEAIKPYFEKFVEPYQMLIRVTDFQESRGSDCVSVRFIANEDRFNITRRNPVKEQLREYNVLENKHIPIQYLINDRETRLQLAAGLVDSDGSVNQEMKLLDFTFISDSLARTVAWLFRSLGFLVSESFKEAPKICDTVYYRVSVSGDLSIIPVKHNRKRIDSQRGQIKNPLVTGFEIQDLGEGDYYGFTLDKDGRFLLGDFTVTHNTSTAKIMSSSDSVKYLSGSNDFNIDTLREKVYSFAGHKSVTGQQKTIIIDEFENIRDNIQDAFKIILDQAKSTNFIFCTNEVEKVNSAVRSRCTNFEYDFINSNYEEFFKLYSGWLGKIVREILQDKGIEYSKEIHGPALVEIRKNNFPDFRHTLVTLQSIIDSEQDITVESVSKCSVNTKQLVELYKLVMDQTIPPDKLYGEICKYKDTEKDALLSLGEPFFKYLNDRGLYDKTIMVATVVSKYCDSYLVSINKFVTFMACINELRTIFR